MSPQLVRWLCRILNARDGWMVFQDLVFVVLICSGVIFILAIG